MDLLKRVANNLSEAARLHQIACDVQARNPGQPIDQRALLEALYGPALTQGREDISRQALENGGRVELPNLGREMLVRTADDEMIRSIKAAAKRRQLRTGAAGSYRPVYVIQVPLDMSAPLFKGRRSLLNGLLAAGSLSIIMHWAIRIDDTFFELKRYPGQRKPGFEKTAWEEKKIRSITKQEFFGNTSMTEEEINAIGTAYIAATDKGYDLLDNNCQRLVHEILHHIVDLDSTSSMDSSHLPAGSRIGSILAASVGTIPHLQRRIQRESPEGLQLMEYILSRQYGEQGAAQMMATLPQGKDAFVHAASEIWSEHSGRILRRLS